MAEPARDTSPPPLSSAEEIPRSIAEAHFSVVIPVFNSERIVGTTIDRTVGFLRHHGLSFEVICVNDGSRDDSWRVLEQKSTEYAELKAIDLLRNYGQHNAVMCGLRESVGDWVVTLDDDLQNPPEEIVHLLKQANYGGNDAVFARFIHKQASGTRKLGTRVIELINRRIFGQPADLAITNFRLLRRDVVERICEDRSVTPYINGLVLLYSRHPANAEVRHAQRAEGQSNYNVFRILR